MDRSNIANNTDVNDYIIEYPVFTLVKRGTEESFPFEVQGGSALLIFTDEDSYETFFKQMIKIKKKRGKGLVVQVETIEFGKPQDLLAFIGTCRQPYQFATIDPLPSSKKHCSYPMMKFVTRLMKDAVK